MAKLHILKNSENEAVVKIYTDNSSGEVIDLSLENDLTTSKQVYVAGTVSNGADETTNGEYATYDGSHATITGVWWGAKDGKRVDVERIISTGPDVLHNHFYFIGAGYHDYKSAGFADRIYANKDIRVTFAGGEGFIILRLTKAGWNPKVETATFSIYDDTTAVGS